MVVWGAWAGGWEMVAAGGGGEEEGEDAGVRFIQRGEWEFMW